MRLLTALLVLGFTAGIGVSASAQNAERTVYVSVLDRSGAPVTGLPGDRFVVTEDGQTREVLRAARTTDRLDLGILVDNSTASQPTIQDLRKALLPFMTRMAKDGHSVALIGMADRPTVLTDYTTSVSALEAGVGHLFARPGSGTVFQDAIVDVTRGLTRRESARRALLVITTEGTDFSNVPYQRTLQALRESGATLHTAVFRSRGDNALRNQNARERGIVIDQGTRDTGGRREELLTSMALDDALSRLAAEIEQQYEVVYSRPEALIPPKTIAVDVTGDDDLVVRATPARDTES